MVLAAGRGSRMREAVDATLDPGQRAAADQGIKAMIPDARGRPFLDHVFTSLADAGVTDVCLVVGTNADPILRHYQRQPPTRIALRFQIQYQPRGTADAVLLGERWSAGRDFLVVNSDNLYPAEALSALVALGAPGLAGFTPAGLLRHGTMNADRLGSFALLDVLPDHTLASIVEKPGGAAITARTNAGGPVLIGMNLWRFDTRIFEACRGVELSSRGEYELPVAVALAITRGVVFRVVPVDDGVFDLTRRTDVAYVAAQLAGRSVAP